MTHEEYMADLRQRLGVSEDAPPPRDPFEEQMAAIREFNQQLQTFILSGQQDDIIDACGNCEYLVKEFCNCQHFAAKCGCGGRDNIAKAILRGWQCPIAKWKYPIDKTAEVEVSSSESATSFNQ